MQLKDLVDSGSVNDNFFFKYKNLYEVELEVIYDNSLQLINWSGCYYVQHISTRRLQIFDFIL